MRYLLVSATGNADYDEPSCLILPISVKNIAILEEFRADARQVYGKMSYIPYDFDIEKYQGIGGFYDVDFGDFWETDWFERFDEFGYVILDHETASKVAKSHIVMDMYEAIFYPGDSTFFRIAGKDIKDESWADIEWDWLPEVEN